MSLNALSTIHLPRNGGFYLGVNRSSLHEGSLPRCAALLGIRCGDAFPLDGPSGSRRTRGDLHPELRSNVNLFSYLLRNSFINANVNFWMKGVSF